MELGPIFRALMYNKTRFWLIAVEVALTFAIVANCVSVSLDMKTDIDRPTGYDIDNMVVVSADPISPEYEDEEYLYDVRDRDLTALTAHPGVIGVTAAHAIPLSGGGSAGGRKPLGSELDNSTAPYFVVRGDVVESLGVEVIAGRGFELGDWEYEELEDGTIPHRNVIISQELATEMFPDGDALGEVIQNDDGSSTNTIIGITRHMHNSWPQGWSKANHALLFPGQAVNSRRMNYIVRTEAGALDAVFPELEAVVAGVQADRLFRLRTLQEFKDGTYSGTSGVVKVLSSVIVLLLFVTALGIVGLTSFSVAQRTRQIGTRRALGAKRSDIVRYFLVENWLITGLGLVVGLGLALALNYALVQIIDAPKLDPWLLVGGMALLWITGVAAAIVPALRASSVAPEVATRSV